MTRTNRQDDAYRRCAHTMVDAKYIGKVEGLSIYEVDGTQVRNRHDPDFSTGAHDLRYRWIPKGEIWVDRRLTKEDAASVIVHEIVERDGMKRGNTYEEAHPYAIETETFFRAEYREGDHRGKTACQIARSFLKGDRRRPRSQQEVTAFDRHAAHRARQRTVTSTRPAARRARYGFAWHCPSPPPEHEEQALAETDFGIVDYIVDHAEPVDPEEFLTAIGGHEVLIGDWWGGWPSSLPTDEQGVIDVLYEDIEHGPYGGLYKSHYPDGTQVYFHQASGIEHVYEPIQ